MEQSVCVIGWCNHDHRAGAALTMIEQCDRNNVAGVRDTIYTELDRGEITRGTIRLTHYGVINS